MPRRWAPLALLGLPVCLAQTPLPKLVRGRVVDSTGRGIRSAELTLQGPDAAGSTRAIVHTDALGAFTLPSIRVPTPVTLRAPGFAALHTEIDPAQASSGTDLTFTLRPDSVAQEVTVTASRSATPLGDTAKTVDTLSREQIQAYPAMNLDEALRQHAGFELFRRAPSRIANPTSEGISLRGLGSSAASRTLVLEDGAPLNDPFGGYIHWDEVPELDVESVTLVTGGGSDLYGSSALGGVIDVLPERVGEAPARLEFSAAGGSEETSDLQAVAAARTRAGGLLLGGQSVRTAGYVVTAPALPGAVDVPANVLSQAFHAEAGRRDEAVRRVFLTGNVLNETRDNGTPLQTNATRLWRYLGGYEAPQGARVDTRVRLFGSEQGYRQSFSSIAADRDSETLTRLQRVHTQERGASADATGKAGPVALVAGADVRDIRGEDNETPISKGLANGLQDVSARQRFVGGFGEALGARGPWSGAVSLRADRASNLDIVQTTRTVTAGTQTRPPDRSEIVLSPRAGLERTLGPLFTAHASGFRAFRTPTMNELYRTGQVGQEITLANAGLVSERGTGYEFGSVFRSRSGAARAEATYFWTEVNRPVAAVLVSQTATSVTEQRENLGQIRSRGVELSGHFWSGRPLSVDLGYQYARATVTQFSAQPSLVGHWIPQVPRESLTVQVRGERHRVGELTLALRASGMQFDDSANQFPLAGFVAVDLSGRHAFSPRAEAFFLIENLTDRRAQVSRTPVLTLGSPIFAEGGLRIRLGASRGP